MQRTLLASLLFALSFAAHAADGQILITHAKAMAGNVTPGDTPGYPVTISKSGSYVLGSDLMVPDLDTSGIQVTATDVNINLNGFNVMGPNACIVGLYNTVTSCPQGSGFGVVSNSNRTTLRNGSVVGMGEYGVNLWNDANVDNVVVSHSGSTGIVIVSGQVINSRVIHNGYMGISVNESFLLSGNIIKGNKHYGIMAFNNGLVTGNTSAKNGVEQLWVPGYGVGYSNNVFIGDIDGHGTDLGGNLVY